MNTPYNDDIEPRTQTSASLRGGDRPIPPHNGPPVLTAIGMPDPERNPDDVIPPIIECASDEEAQATIRQMGYFVTKIGVRQPNHAQSMTPERASLSAWQSTMKAITETYWSVRDQLIEAVEAFNIGAEMASASKKHPKVLS